MSSRRDDLTHTVGRQSLLLDRLDADLEEARAALEAAGMLCDAEGPGGVRCQRPKRVPHGFGQHTYGTRKQRRTW
jgi:hypothetical protein